MSFVKLVNIVCFRFVSRLFLRQFLLLSVFVVVRLTWQKEKYLETLNWKEEEEAKKIQLKEERDSSWPAIPKLFFSAYPIITEKIVLYSPHRKSKTSPAKMGCPVYDMKLHLLMRPQVLKLEGVWIISLLLLPPVRFWPVCVRIPFMAQIDLF